MPNLRPARIAALVLVAAAVAAPAAAQEMTEAEIEGFLNDHCRDRGTHQRKLGLAMRLSGGFERLSRGLRSRMSRYWENPGYLLVSDQRAPDSEPSYYALPLSSISARPLGASMIAFRCAESRHCIWSFVRGHQLEFTMTCNRRDRVIQLLDTWIDRNVTRMEGAPPFAD